MHVPDKNGNICNRKGTHKRRRRSHIERVFIRSFAGEGNLSPQEQAAEQKNIAVTGLSRNVGTTFLATALAFYFAEKGNSLTFVQCLDPKGCTQLLFDSAAMDKRFARRGFTDVYRKIRDKQPVRGIKNMEKGINWILPTPGNCEEAMELTGEEKGRLIQSAGGQICIFDIEASGNWDVFLNGMDQLIVVTDPLPSKMIRSSSRFRLLKQLELSGCPVFWIVNHANRGISRRQVSGYLKTAQIIWIEEFPADMIYADEFSCRFHWENRDIKCHLLEKFTKISQ